MADRVSLPQGQEVNWDYEAYQNQPPQSSTSEAVGAAWDLAKLDSGMGLLARYTAKKDLEARGAKPLAPDEANERYPGMPKPFREPVDPYVAQMLSDQNDDRNALQQKLMNGPDDRWSKTKMFGAGLVAHVMDPMEFGAGALSGWGVGGLFARTAMGARFATESALASQVAEHAALGIRPAANAALAETLAGQASKMALQKVGFHAVESLGGNIVQNVGQEVALAKVQTGENQDYDIHEGINNAITTAAFGTLFHMGVKELPGVMGGARKLARNLFSKAPEADLPVVRTVVGQMERGANPDIGPIVKTIATETDIRPGDVPGKFEYNYEPLTKDTLEGRKFYVAAKPGADFHAAEKMQIGDEHAVGPQATDNPGVANVAANRSFSDGSGVVWEVDGSKLNPLDLKQPVSDDMRPHYAEALKGIVDNPEAFLKDATHGDVLNAMWNAADDGSIEPKAILDLQEKMKEAGYNSVLDDGTNVMGESHRPHNLVTLLDSTAVEPKGFKETDPSIRKEPSAADLNKLAQDAQDPLNSDLIDREQLHLMDEEIKDMDSQGPQDPLTDLDKNIQEYVEDTATLEKTGQADAERLKTVEDIKAFEAFTKDKHTLLKALKNCVGI